MSQIFAPGAIAGPPSTFLGAYNAGTTYTLGQAVSSGGSSFVSLLNGNVGNAPASSPSQWGLLAAAGSAGAAGAAGSAAAVSLLAGAVMPNFAGRNLFDSTQVTDGYYVNPGDGTLTSASGNHASALIYCPGATKAITNLPIDFNVGCIAYYDANGAFLSSQGMSYYDGLGLVDDGPGDIRGYTAFPLAGTQTYIRFSYQDRWGSDHAADAAHAMFYAALSGTPTLPGSYAPCGLDTVADVNAKDAVVAANAALALSSGLGTAFGFFAGAVLPTSLGQRNLFDFTRVIPGKQVNPDGSLSSGGGMTTATILCPGATDFIANLPIRGVPNSIGVVLLDGFGNFIEDISTTTFASDWGGPNNALVSNHLYSGVLPGTQTYVRFSFAAGNFNSYGAAADYNAAMFFAGNSASPCPSTLPAIAPYYASANSRMSTATHLGCDPLGIVDATATLNAFLATASSSNPIELILDGMFNTSGLVISPNGYTTIRGLGAGTGIILVNNSSPFTVPQDGIRIGAYTAGTGNSEGAYNITPPSRTAVNIVLRDFSINAANQVNAGANQPLSGAVAHGTYPVILNSCSNVLIDNLTFPVAGANYCITLSNVDHVRIANCDFVTSGYVHDGIHIDGVCEDIGIDNCDFATGDDAIALNAPEGYGGDISRVTITNCRFKGSLTVMRIYTSVTTATFPTNNVHRVRNVTMSNCSGYSTTACFNLGITDGVNPTTDVEQLVDFSVDNCSFSSPEGLAGLFTPMGSINFRNVVFLPTGTAALFNGFPSSVARLAIEGLTIRRNSDANAAPSSVVGISSGALGRVVLKGVAVVDTPGSSYTAMGALVSTAQPIAMLDLDGIDMTQVTALVDGSGWTNVTTVRGPGVISTGASIPDAKMENGTLYLSSDDSGAVSMKVGGTAKRLTLT